MFKNKYIEYGCWTNDVCDITRIIINKYELPNNTNKNIIEEYLNHIYPDPSIRNKDVENAFYKRYELR